MRASEPIYLKMRSYLLDIIEKNRDVPNFKLPSENQLAERFGASRISSKKALQTLEAEGLIYRAQGKGSFITDKANQLAPREKGEEADIVCLLVPVIERHFSAQAVEGLRERFSQLGVQLVILTTEDDPDKEAQMVRFAQKIGCKGIVICPVVRNRYSDEMLKLALMRFPVVQFDRYLPGLHLSYVSCDHCLAAYRAVKLLKSRGHERIVFVNDSPDYTTSVADRIRGFDRAMGECSPGFAGMAKCLLNVNDPAFDAKINAYLDQYAPTAILSHSYQYGGKLLHVLLKRGYPRQMPSFDLMLFDNMFAEALPFMDFKPIIIDQNPQGIARTAADLLYQQIYCGAPPQTLLSPERVLLPK